MLGAGRNEGARPYRAGTWPMRASLRPGKGRPGSPNTAHSRPRSERRLGRDEPDGIIHLDLCDVPSVRPLRHHLPLSNARDVARAATMTARATRGSSEVVRRTARRPTVSSAAHTTPSWCDPRARERLLGDTPRASKHLVAQSRVALKRAELVASWLRVRICTAGEQNGALGLSAPETVATLLSGAAAATHLGVMTRGRETPSRA